MKLSYTFYIQSSAEDIWSILTTPEGTEKIFYGAKVVSTFKVGDAIAYVGPGRDGDATRHIEGKILEVIPMQLLAHTYCVGESYRESTPAYESRIRYAIEPLGFAVKLTLTHDQWNPEDPSYENTKNGWWLMLSNIKTLAETGAPLQIGSHA